MAGLLCGYQPSKVIVRNPFTSGLGNKRIKTYYYPISIEPLDPYGRTPHLTRADGAHAEDLQVL